MASNTGSHESFRDCRNFKVAADASPSRAAAAAGNRKSFAIVRRIAAATVGSRDVHRVCRIEVVRTLRGRPPYGTAMMPVARVIIIFAVDDVSGRGCCPPRIRLQN